MKKPSSEKARVTAPLWQKAGTKIDQRVMRFMAGDDVLLDRELFLHDIRASRAHAHGLADIGILSGEELEAIDQSLDQLAAEFEAGRFELDQRFEDGHSAIEAWLTEDLGDAGAKIHTGRSRNDQVAVATRLYLLDALDRLAMLCKRIARTSLDRAEKDPNTPMPGYTHLQRAVVSSVGTWFACFAEAYIDNAELAISTRRWIDANPLGTAAGYGVNLPLNRELTRNDLGFARLQINPLYTQNCRGKFELQTLHALAQGLLDLRRLCWDLSLFTTQEFDFVELPARFTTGSSIMPNKRNPDAVELLRGSYAVVQGATSELQSILSLPSGYQRDLQGTKSPTIRALRHGLDALEIAVDLVAELRFLPDNLKAAIEPAMYATDIAIEQTLKGTPFRQAYANAAESLEDATDRTPERSVAERVSAGAAGDLRLDDLRARLDGLK